MGQCGLLSAFINILYPIRSGGSFDYYCYSEESNKYITWFERIVLNQLRKWDTHNKYDPKEAYIASRNDGKLIFNENCFVYARHLWTVLQGDWGNMQLYYYHKIKLIRLKFIKKTNGKVLLLQSFHHKQKLDFDVKIHLNNKSSFDKHECSWSNSNFTDCNITFYDWAAAFENYYHANRFVNFLKHVYLGVPLCI